VRTSAHGCGCTSGLWRGAICRRPVVVLGAVVVVLELMCRGGGAADYDIEPGRVEGLREYGIGEICSGGHAAWLW